LERALATADDPAIAGWKGRASQLSQLQRQVRELKDQLKKGEPNEFDVEEGTPQRVPRRSAVVAEKDRAAVDKAAEKRREEFDRLQEEAERLRGEQAEAKRKREALKSRNAVLESQLKELKGHVAMLVQKSENDDELVSAIRRQLGRSGTSTQLDDTSEEVESLRSENEELQAQLERQAQDVLRLKQKSLAAACEAGSARLGPRSAEPGTPTRALSERIRFLEADNVKQSEHVKLLQKQQGEESSGPGRPFSAESSFNLQERLRQMADRLATAERENLELRRNVGETPRPGSGASCRSGSQGPRGLGPPDTEQLLKQNEALKREVAGLRRGGTRDRMSSPCSSMGGDR